MCYSLESSATTSAVSVIVTALVLLTKRHPYHKWCALSTLSVCTMQMAETYLWWHKGDLNDASAGHKGCSENGPNRFGTQVLVILALWMQPMGPWLAGKVLLEGIGLDPSPTPAPDQVQRKTANKNKQERVEQVEASLSVIERFWIFPYLKMVGNNGLSTMIYSWWFVAFPSYHLKDALYSALFDMHSESRKYHCAYITEMGYLNWAEVSGSRLAIWCLYISSAVLPVISAFTGSFWKGAMICGYGALCLIYSYVYTDSPGSLWCFYVSGYNLIVVAEVWFCAAPRRYFVFKNSKQKTKLL